MPWRHELENEFALRKEQNLWRQRLALESAQGKEVIVDGKKYLNFCSNDYLGLANHSSLIAAATQAIEDRGTGSGASHLVCGHSDQHHQLEEQIANFVGAESAIVVSTGYMANLAIPQTFLRRDDLLLQDRLNHASLIDAGRYCPATMKRYPHLDHEFVKEKLSASDSPKTDSRKMVMTDGVFSMDGDIAPLKELHDACVESNAMLVVDDAHGLGVLGEKGIGAMEIANIQPTQNVLMVGTFGKSVGSFGAFVAGDECYIQSLVQHARTYIYTTALPSAIIAATSAAFKIFQNEPDRRLRLKNSITYFCHSAINAGLPIQSNTPIQPIVIGSSKSAIEISKILRDSGIWVSAIRPPTVPVGTSRLRITLTSEHTHVEIDKLINALSSPAVKQLIETQP